MRFAGAGTTSYGLVISKLEESGTASFTHMGESLSGDTTLKFDVAQWRHVALFDAARSRVEMHLEARADLQVRWPQASVRWRAGERVLTEIACKYTVEGFDALLRRAGYAHARCWTDARCWFAVFVAR